jgi:hypothetical protein
MGRPELSPLGAPWPRGLACVTVDAGPHRCRLAFFFDVVAAVSDEGPGMAICPSIVSRCDADHSVNRGGPTQWVSGWVCAGPNRSPLAWERSVERLTPYPQLWLGFTCQFGSSRWGYYPAIATR